MTDLRTTATALSLGAHDLKPWFELLNYLAPSNEKPARQLAPPQGPRSSKRVFVGSSRGFEVWSGGDLTGCYWQLDSYWTPLWPTMQCSVVLFRIVGWKQWTLVGNVIQTAAQRHWESSWVGARLFCPVFIHFPGQGKFRGQERAYQFHKFLKLTLFKFQFCVALQW